MTCSQAHIFDKKLNLKLKNMCTVYYFVLVFFDNWETKT